ncbi:gamma carbonic anhydrase family protein [Demequina sp. NBRC 110056]|uniref:gamma carbonic anhydrase family protein n=1 Tax=Demequina sp. NBRC 110056 TaxID=1570345 RepID=UPI000A069E54|nr:gamma carbonic anhydrase family protein [Demequina sp. NBRC 110056]
MLIESRGASPTIHPSAYVAPSAVVCGDVRVGEGSRILHGAVLTAEDGPVTIGARVVVMENAVIKGRRAHPAVVGDHVLIGPHAHLNGATVESESFIATGASLFPGCLVRERCEVRVNAVIQVNTALAPRSVVPIGWIAVGDPAQLLPAHEHAEIWRIQEGLDFPGTVYDATRTSSMEEIMARQSAFYGEHANDVVIDDAGRETSGEDER